ncbi:hypothetical protein [Pararcticibacter amylolyticus]|uniref:Uncharacterized protein n=1 Tax=Pararcticibacter amylolyticus TaxID=2173175 RepID=A0A2U2PD20_9SPHI|nr:hypothetical protein [Pararcticibacter amylolyticus]PWG79285.1 hypothetical protein DDR33_17330 [Pararcticibacter amylolyticus]
MNRNRGTFSVEDKKLLIFPDWEDRAYEGFLRDIESQNFEEVVIINYGDGLHAEKTEDILSKIVAVASRRGLKFSKIDLKKNDFLSNWVCLEEIFSKPEFYSAEVFVDITTMPREVIWILLYNLRKFNRELSWFYHKPQSYNSDWLTREPDLPRLLLKHSGIIDPSKQTALVIITGFDGERVKQLLNFYDPKKVVMGIQSGTQFENDVRNNPRLFDLEVDCEFLNIDAYGQGSGFSAINEKIKAMVDEYNIVIASLGPKLTALSMYMLYIEHPEIALAYLPCKDFNLDYSYGIGDTLQGSLMLKRSDDLLS